MADTAPLTTGRMTRSMARTGTTPSVQCARTEKAPARTKKATDAMGGMPRMALFDISNKAVPAQEKTPKAEKGSTAGEDDVSLDSFEAEAAP
eukprot:CAMPEP_0117698504 /NCGR_PEP_ID=MMETSP0804-20121206/29793_1 /TAXON_ID=1074897 /ORGANISM="Tetraselmis astigmatica, Strain CCMP880" /LENGTH=91 /DNA_ID=CAMNT_0005512817 /DNA_START=444 /DNA_END=716 /DNA_ORIENTATION=+